LLDFMLESTFSVDPRAPSAEIRPGTERLRKNRSRAVNYSPHHPTAAGASLELAIRLWAVVPRAAGD
jgi:hypothetical protein